MKPEQKNYIKHFCYLLIGILLLISAFYDLNRSDWLISLLFIFAVFTDFKELEKRGIAFLARFILVISFLVMLDILSINGVVDLTDISYGVVGFLTICGFIIFEYSLSNTVVKPEEIECPSLPTNDPRNDDIYEKKLFLFLSSIFLIVFLLFWVWKLPDSHWITKNIELLVFLGVVCLMSILLSRKNQIANDEIYTYTFFVLIFLSNALCGKDGICVKMGYLSERNGEYPCFLALAFILFFSTYLFLRWLERKDH